MGPFSYPPDPDQPVYAAAKAEKLVRRGPREFYLVGRKRDGEEVEARLVPAVLRTDV